MIGSSLVGARADLLIELVVLAQVLGLPVLAWSVGRARRGAHGVHRATQIALTVVFAAAVVALEVDIRLAGGTARFLAGGAFEGTPLLHAILYGHLAVAMLNACVWIGLPLVSVRRARRGALPGAFSRTHRRAGWLAVTTFTATSLSGVALYVVGFWL